MLYYKNRNTSLSLKTSKYLASIRFVVVTLLAFLLLNPLIKRFMREKELPVIILAADNSSSMLVHSSDTAKDAAFLRDVVLKIEKELHSNYKVESFMFGEDVKDTFHLNFIDKETDISAVFTMLENRYAGRNTGAVILLTDGIYNKGFNPASIVDKMNTTVYSLLWGDTTRKRDLILAEVNYNRIAYLGNTFPMEIIVKASRSDGLQSKLVVRSKEKVFHNIPFSITGDQFVKIFQLNMLADKEGILDFEILVEGLPDELTLTNNRTRAFIEVLTSRKRVIIISSKPHPDIGAIKNALGLNDMIDTEVVRFNDYKPKDKPPDLVILHQLPDDQLSGEIFSRFLKEKTPMMIIGGGNTRTDLLTSSGVAPRIIPGRIRDQHNEAIGWLNPGFSLFTVVNEFTDQLSELPPLYIPYGKTESLPGGQSLLLQKIGKVETSYPLISFNSKEGTRNCFIGGEGLWKWRMFSFRNEKNHRPFDTFINQIVQYLTASDDRKRFRVSNPGYVTENQNITFSAELYDAAYNPVVDPEVSLRIESTDLKNYDFTFTRKERAYSLDAGRLPVGEYKYIAQTSMGNEKFSATGRFVIAPLNLEATVTVADHGMMKNLSNQTKGIAAYLNDYESVIDHIRQKEDIKPISHLREKFTDFTTILWLLALILLLLSVEWFIRKREGVY